MFFINFRGWCAEFLASGDLLGLNFWNPSPQNCWKLLFLAFLIKLGEKFGISWIQMIFSPFLATLGEKKLAKGLWESLFCAVGREAEPFAPVKKNSPKIAENHYFEVLNNFSKKKFFLIRIFWIFLRSPLTEKKIMKFFP